HKQQCCNPLSYNYIPFHIMQGALVSNTTSFIKKMTITQITVSTMHKRKPFWVLFSYLYFIRFNHYIANEKVYIEKA
ncbi:hypothetical protein ACJX0J_020206, partial [Zea mays]